MCDEIVMQKKMENVVEDEGEDGDKRI